MKKNLLIDPHMFLLKNDTEIRDNLDFFRAIIQLCNGGKISIVLYQGLLERICNWQIAPFPIGVSDIEDSALIEQVLILNRNFRQVLSSNINAVEIGECKGSQDLGSEPDLTEDSDYYELLNVILRTCYSKLPVLEPYILVGDVRGTQKVGDSVTVTCSCDECEFRKEYKWCTPWAFEDDKDKALDLLKKTVGGRGDRFIKSPETIRADHHCPLQRKSIKTYEDFTAKNKMVLSLLRYFGLYKIILTEFHEDTSYPAGTIVIDKLSQGNDSEIAEGWLFCQTGFKSGIRLYFPKEIGSALCTYTEKHFDYMKVEALKSSLCL